MKKIYNFKIVIGLLMTCLSAWSQTPNWSSIGPNLFPSNIGGQINGIGRVVQIKFDPINTTRMYAVTPHTVFRSDDTANTWNVVPGADDLPSGTNLASLCIDHTNNQVIYLGTGDPNYYSSSTASGVWKSTDNGTTFTLSNTGMGNKLVTHIVMSPTDNNILVAATNAGIYRSTNGGASWTLITTSSAKFTDMCVKPGAGSSTIYAVEKNTQNFYSSTDFGATWNIKTLSTTLISNGGRVNVTAADPEVVYVAFLGSNNASGGVIIYKSTDSGNTFTLKKGDNLPNLAGYSATTGGQGDYNFDIGVDPLDPNTIYSCGHLVWKSTDGGANWVQKQTSWGSVLHTDQHDLVFNPNNSNQLFNANDGGVWLNTDHVATNTWAQKSNGLAGMEIYNGSFANSRIKKDMIGIGTQDNGELFYKDGVWTCNRGGDWTDKHYFDYGNAGKIYYVNTAKRRDLIQSPNGSQVAMGLPNPSNNDWYAFSKQNVNIGFCAQSSVSTGNYGLYITNNLQSGVPNWSLMNGFVPAGQIAAIAVSPLDANIMYVMSKNKTIARSTNALGDGQFTQVSPAPKPSGTPSNGCLSVLRNGVVFMSSDGYVYRSANQGVTWSPLGSGSVTTILNGQRIKNLIADSNNPTKEAVYALTSQGVYYIDNTLTDWMLYSADIPTTVSWTGMEIFNDPINPANNVLRVSSYGRGVWETPIANSVGILPVATITSPVDASNATEGGSLQIDATASDADGIITKVKFFMDGLELGESTTSPYSFTANNMKPGAHRITVKAIDDLGNEATSATVNVFVNSVPAIADTFVKDGGSANTNYGSSTLLELKKEGVGYNREVFLKFDLSTLPASFNKATLDLNISSTSTNMTPTTWELYYVADDSWSESTVNWNNKPAAGTLLATVSSQISGVVKWNITTPVLNEIGTDKILSLKLVSTVAGSATATSFNAKEGSNSALRPQISVTSLVNELPTVAITAPVNNTKLTGPLNMTINADAADTDGNVTKVEFFNGATKLGEDFSAPYSYTWNNAPVGTHNLTAKASDDSGDSVSSTPVTFIVNPNYGLLPVADAFVQDGTSSGTNYGADTKLLVKTDGNNSGFYRKTYLKFDLSQYQTDTFDIGKLVLTLQTAGSSVATHDYELWYCSNDSWTETGINWNNQPALTTKLGTLKGKPAGSTMEWDINNQLKNEIGGDKILTLAVVKPVRASGSTDLTFFSKESSTIVIKKPNIIAENLPVISLTSPANGTVVNFGDSVTLSADASDDKSLINVKFYIDGIEKATVLEAPFTWDAAGLSPGTYIIQAKATDASGLVKETPAVTITVKDTIAPVISCPGNIEVNNDSDQCGAIVSFAATATDNFSFATVTYNHEPGSLFPIGTTTVTATAKDVEGNAATCTFTVNVKDTQAPVATVQNLTTVIAECSATVTAPEATDNCAGIITATTTDPTTYNTQGTHTVHWTYNDGNGNTITQEQTVIIEDNSTPTIVCPENIVLTACQDTATWSLPVVNDNCSNVVVTQTEGPASGSTFENGTTTTISYEAKDAGGNTANCSFTVTRQSGLDLTVSNSNPQLYFGYSLDQSTTITGIPTGGTAPYTVSITMDRPLMSDVVNSSGDEIWISDTNSVTATLMETAIFTVTVTDANGCSVSKTTTVNAEDARCFAGNNTKIKICHKTGNNNNPYHELCVDQSAVQAHLDHGDSLGTCSSNGITSRTTTKVALDKESVEIPLFNVIAYPNPTNNQFTLELEGGNNENIEIQVYDMLARKVKQITRKAGQPILFGEEFPIGEYVAVIKQGNNIKTVNLLKK